MYFISNSIINLLLVVKLFTLFVYIKCTGNDKIKLPSSLREAYVDVYAKIYIIGGVSQYNYYAYCFDTQKNQWTKIQETITDRGDNELVTLNNTLYTLGGWNSIPQTSVEKYNQLNDSWEEIASMNIPRANFASAVINNTIYACGGWSKYDPVTPAWIATNSCEYYSSDKNMWTLTTPLSGLRVGFALIALKNNLYIMGGNNGQQLEPSLLNSLEKYDPNSKKWDSLAPMLIKRVEFGATIYNNHIYVCGGSNGKDVEKTCEIYDDNTNQWKFIAPMNMQFA